MAPIAIVNRVMISVMPVGLAHPGNKPNICGFVVNNQSTEVKLEKSLDSEDVKLFILTNKTGSGTKFE